MISSAWRADLDSFEFQPADHAGRCVVHRRAFGTLLGHSPTPEECIHYFQRHRVAFETAARAKIRGAMLAAPAHIHLTSRDIARCLRR